MAHLSLLIITHLGPRLGVDNAGDFHFHPNIRVNPSLVNMNFRLIYNRKYNLSLPCTNTKYFILTDDSEVDFGSNRIVHSVGSLANVRSTIMSTHIC